MERKKMNSDRLDSFLGKPRQDRKSEGGGLSMGDILALPDRQQQIINWIIRQKECTLSQIADYLSQEESATRSELEALVQQGFVQESQAGESSKYSVKLAAKRGSRIPEGLE
ncbi:MAG TPA: hypothetical protein DCY91_23335 [Cyanobacteria bacterium UBA11370]|nr:hypothetical protein [Cyanobacteria bacterium UBA11370]HBY78384.1 hypothetical protein [Cyanobacteria bacterium UBA11148]